MPGIRDIEEILPTLTPGEKAQLLKWVVSELNDAAAGIDSKSEVCGGAACIVRTRIPVWILEQLRRQGASEQSILAAYPTLRAEDLVNAWAYVRSHGPEVEAQIRDNEAA